MIARDRHSRTIALLKVAFPLSALALLSTLFLLSRAMETETAIPFADKEIQDRLRDQQITGPFFSGSTPDGDKISFSAQKLITLNGRVGTNRAEDATASLETARGAKFELKANVVELDIAGDTAALTGDVSMVTSTGYHINTAQLDALVSRLDITAPQEVYVDGPLGTLTAGKMHVFSSNQREATQMIFSGGVKLVYVPN
ncbi:hypothetical protein [Sulfitobacter sp.]|uniref:hypothetical protein n=1 Tax=Sulfitobacter sp. TaxID=1903071 RepID=UPI00300161B1